VLGPPNLPGWDHVPVVDFFAGRLGIETRLSNDANAGAIAEWRWGAGRGTATMAFLTFGTGLGAGLIIDGRLHCGWRGLAGEVGHVRVASSGPVAYGKAGSWEGYSSGNGIRRLAIERIRGAWADGDRPAFCPDETALAALDVPALASAARDGDPVALGVFRTSGEFLGQGIAILADLIDPEVVVVGGIYGRCIDLLAEPTLEAFESESLGGANGRARIVPAGLGEAIGDWSALAVALTDQPARSHAR
jgi:glucokinase